MKVHPISVLKHGRKARSKQIIRSNVQFVYPAVRRNGFASEKRTEVWYFRHPLGLWRSPRDLCNENGTSYFLPFNEPEPYNSMNLGGGSQCPTATSREDKSRSKRARPVWTSKHQRNAVLTKNSSQTNANKRMQKLARQIPRRLNPKVVKRRLLPSFQQSPVKDVKYYIGKRQETLVLTEMERFFRETRVNSETRRPFNDRFFIEDRQRLDKYESALAVPSFDEASQRKKEIDDEEEHLRWSSRNLNNNENKTMSRALMAKKLGCGGTAGILSRTLTAPCDRLRILMMTSVDGLGVQGAISTATNGGVSRLWMGNGVNCLKVAPEMSIKLLSFDLVKDKIAQDPTKVSVGERFVAGGVAGVLSQLSIYPMEVVKTRLAMSGPGEINGMADCMRQTFLQGGYRAFYAGVGPSIVGIIPYAAIDLSLNSLLKDICMEYYAQYRKKKHGEMTSSSATALSVPLLLGCGMVSSGTATILTFPLNVIRTKARATGEPFGAVLGMLQSQGWRAFYRGLVPCLAKVLPATSISYAAYEYLGGAWERSMSVALAEDNRKRIEYR